jgi:hypothetical protein
MAHEPFTEKISLWLTNELSDPEIAELQAHLADCSICQHTYQAWQQVETLLHAGSTMVMGPASGFTSRFESRLAHHHARNGGHIWLGFGVLLLGTLFLFIIGGIVAATLVSAGAGLVDVDTLYRGLARLIESANTVGVWLNLVALFIKVSLITMSQPLFWVSTLMAVGMVWLWLRLLKFLNRQSLATIELLTFQL